jgi:flagellar hook-length control protein FliK
MTMASTTVNSTNGLDVSVVMNVRAASNSKNATSSTQNFGSVLNSTTQNSKSDQKTQATTSTASTNNSSSNTVKDTSSQDTTTKDTSSQDTNVKDNTVKDTAKDDVQGQVKDTDNQAAQEPTEDEADDTIIEEIATALNVILDQIKELIGVDDDAIAATMEDLGLNQGDLLNSDNLAQLVTALSGEESIISLVANEDLYSKLQTLTEVVDTQFETVLDNTGIGEEELNQVLENFAVEENPIEEIPVEANQVTEPQENVESDEPVVTVQDNTTKPATTYSKLPENQQDTTELVSENQSSNSKTEKNQNNQSKDYSENQSFSQNQETAVNENVSEVTENTASSYTSDSTESIMRQLADTVKLIKEDNLTQMELQLHPASLGTVNVSLITKGGAVTAQFTTQSEQVRAAIESQAAQLQQDLENQGVKVEAIDVTVESHQMERNLDQENSRKEKEGEQTEESMKATRRANINLRTLGENGDVLEEIQGADEATRIAMELMSANGNTMDMLA